MTTADGDLRKMSDAAAAPKKKKGGSMKLVMMLVVALGLGGAGTVGGLYAAGVFSKTATGPKEDFNRPQLVLKGEDAEEIGKEFLAKAEAAEHEAGAGHEAAAGHEGAKKHGIDLPAPANPAQYQASYFQIQMPFTSNMADSDSFAQISVAVSTYYDGRVIEAMKTHEMAIRSAVLMMLAEQSQLALATPQGKEALQAELKKIINAVLKQKTGYGGVDNVYFTNFVIQ
jgi:flagellar FliL protein